MLAIVVATLLHQAPAEGWRITWRAPEGCSAAEVHSRAVETRLGRPVFREPAIRFVEGSVARGETGWVVKLVVTDASGSPLGQREVTSTESACVSIDGRVALVLSLLIDPSSRLGGSIVATPAPTPLLPEPTGIAPEALVDQDRVRLEVVSDEPAVRVVELRAGASWKGTIDVCGVPCGALVLRTAQLSITGPDVLPAEFGLSRSLSPTARVSVKASSLSRQIWSIVSITFAATLVGLSAVGFALSSNSSTGVALSATSGVIGIALGILGGVGLSQGPTVVHVSE